MLTQAMHAGESDLKQLPHASNEVLARFKSANVSTILQLQELEDDEKMRLLDMTPAQLSDVARFCNAYPSLTLTHEVAETKVDRGYELNVEVQREEDTWEEHDGKRFAPPVVAPYYPQKRKEEGWWLVLGEPATNQLLSIKRLTVNDVAKAKITFTLADDGRHSLKLYLMCDSYLGADQEFDIVVGHKNH